MAVTDPIPEGVPLLRTRIPEGRKVGGLEYGSHVQRHGWEGYYVRPEGMDAWGVARTTPASDELQPDDAGILLMIEEELEEPARPDPRFITSQEGGR